MEGLSPLAPPPNNQAHLVRFRGCVHPKGESNDYDGLMLTEDQISQWSDAIVGTKIWNRHQNEQLGWITAGYAAPSPDNRLIVDCVIDRSLPGGVTAARELANGTLKALSLGMENTVYENDDLGIMRVVAQRIEEVSVVEEGDLPDTFIHEIAPDSEMWEVGKQRVRNEMACMKTKTKIDKNDEEIVGLLHEARKSIAKPPVPVTMSGEAPPPTPVADAAAAAAGTPASDATTGGDAAGLSELEALRAQSEASAKRNADLEAKLASREALFADLKSDPDRVKALIAKDEEEKVRKSAQFAEEEEELVQKVTADMITRGMDPKDHPKIFDALRAMKDHPEAAEHLHTLVTVAGAANEKRATEAEARYQETKEARERDQKERDALSQRLVEAEASQKRMEADFQQQQQRDSRKAQHAAYVSGEDAQDSRQGKRPRADEAEPADVQAAAAAAAASGRASSAGAGASPDNVFFFALPPAGTVGARPFRAENPVRRDAAEGDEASQALLSMFEGHTGQTGMPMMNDPAFVGQVYDKPTEGMSSHGEIIGSEILTQRPPIKF